MLTKEKLKDLLTCLGFENAQTGHDVLYFHFDNLDCSISVDFENEKIIYPDSIEADRDTTKNFSHNENFVVLECVIGLLNQGYKPEHIVLEPETPGGRENTNFYCDIMIRDNDKRPYMLIECKTMDGKEDDEFNKAWKKTQQDGGQLFNYYNTYRQAQYLALYASDFIEGEPRCEYRLITMTDNKEYLESNTNLISFEKVSHDNGTIIDFFRVWSETYGKDYATNGAFEVDEVPPFGVTQKRKTIDDLNTVDSSDIQKKHHEFAQILRQYNVASHENAFDKLVNLFLVKVVDEVSNKDDLQFLWRGAAYDDFYSFQDRLQKLYQIGMKEFLGEDVTYIDNAKIEEAFHMQRNDPDAIKETIIDYFRQLKFYSNSDFGFLDVHNKQLFFQNAVILKAMVEMLQDIRLKTDVQNQFLGDLFEDFLDQGVKQNEGQFFTSTPITHFMVSSLPLEKIIKDSLNIPMAIDYACGAGHFLNEYATQIEPFVIKHRGKNLLHDYYKNIFGIEKEYRLSKVSKVSSFMYGQDEIQIVYGDALVPHNKIKDGEFQVLVANPPYSVKGFLTTLSKEERKSFDLSNEVKDKALDTNDYIESFFIERAKQLLAPEGVATIILPYTILAGSDSMYKKTREIILQYFDIISIAHFGDGTFGRTGTNTAVLFMRRKKSTPDVSKHCKIRIDSWFKNDHSQDNRYQDTNIYEDYAMLVGLTPEQYLGFMSNNLSDDFIASEMYNRYYDVYSTDSTANSIRSKKITARYTQEIQDKEIESYILNSIREIEKEKLFYYMLCRTNPTPVVVIESPISENKKDKSEQEFLGYSWSTAKGREGIHYITASDSGSNNDSSGKSKDIKAIITPLFNPRNPYDDSKINTLIRRNYNGEEVVIPDNLKSQVSLTMLHDMIDFSHVTFDESINIVPQHQIDIDSDCDCVVLDKYVSLNEFTYNPTKSEGNIIYVDISSVEKNTGMISYDSIIVAKKAPSRARRIAKSKSILISTVRPNLRGFAYVQDEVENAIYSTGFAIIRSKDEDVIRSKYLYYLFMYLDVIMAQMKAMMPKGAYPSINADDVKKIKIPLPDKTVQDSVIKAIEKVEKEFQTSRMNVASLDKKVMGIFLKLKVVNSQINNG